MSDCSPPPDGLAGHGVLEELVCEVCLGVLNEPKKLDCDHSFCRACLHRVVATYKHGIGTLVRKGSRRDLNEANCNGANAASSEPASDVNESRSVQDESEIAYPCPTCDKITVVPEGDVAQLSTSLALNQLLEINSARLSDGVREEMRQTIRRRRVSTTSLTSTELSSCPDHPGSIQEFYCIECKTLVCGRCMLSRHKEHIDHVKSAEEAEDKMQACLRALMQPSCEAEFSASGVMELIRELKKEVVKESTSCTNHIKQYFNHVREALEKREAELIERVEAESMKSISDLTKKEDVVRRNVGMLSRYVSQVRETLHHPGNMGLLTSTQGLIPTVEYINGQIRNVTLELTKQEKAPAQIFEGPVVDFHDLGSLTGTEKDDIIGDSGYVIVKGSPQSGYNPSPPHLSQRNSSHSSLDTIPEQTAMSDDPVYEEPMAMATYSRRGPKLPPRMSLARRSGRLPKKSVTVSVKHVISCDVQASNMKPFGVAVGETDAVIVSDIHSHCVKVIARSGKVIDTITGPQSPEQIYGPVCLATDSENQLYILDKEGKKAIYRFKNGKFDSGFTNKVHKSYKLNQSWGMAVTDKLIYVTDWQKSCIHIFQANGKYKDMLTCGQQSQAVLKHPVGIAIMPDGSLVVADHESHCVWKVTHTKDVVEFQQIGSENVLDSPYGVAVTPEGYIVVTDTGKSQVCLFASDGTFMTYLGKGSNKGEFITPRHVCATAGGEILVADEGNQRVQVLELLD